jgi:hypothetical protein
MPFWRLSSMPVARMAPRGPAVVHRRADQNMAIGVPVAYRGPSPGLAHVHSDAAAAMGAIDYGKATMSWPAIVPARTCRARAT